MVNRFPQKTQKRLAYASLFLFFLSACSEIAVKDLDPDSYGGTIVPPPSGGSTVSFATDVTPILNSRCGACHPAIAPSLALNTTGATLYSAVSPITSTLLTAPSASHPSGAGQLPSLTQTEKNKITTWISEGAKDN